MNWLARWLCSLLRQSPSMPQHVAFIMDGNRRYAKKNQVQTLTGHTKGYDKLKETLEWCLELGVRMVTVYAFSRDNFKRSPEEVEHLMRLAKDRFTEMLDRLDIIEKYGACVRVLGDVSLLPADVRAAMEKAVEASRHKTKVILNICMSYSHQVELDAASDLIRNGIDEGILIPEDVTPDLIQSCLYTGISATMTSDAIAASAASSHSIAAASSAATPAATSLSQDTLPIPCAPDILLRTSGETRLSDFLCYQVCSETQLVFVRTLWPDFSFLEIARVMLEYQRIAEAKEKAINRKAEQSRQEQWKKDVEAVLRQIEQERLRSTCSDEMEAFDDELACDNEDDDSELRQHFLRHRNLPHKQTPFMSVSATSSSSSSTSAATACALDENRQGSAVTTSEDSNSEASDDLNEQDHSPHGSTPLEHSNSHSPVPNDAAEPDGLRRWSDPLLSQQLRHRFGAKAIKLQNSNQHSVSSTEAVEVPDEVIYRRVEEYVAARQTRLRKFAKYVQASTTCLI